jgi:hypothetical protein
LSSTLGIEEKGIRRSVHFIEVWPARPWLALRIVCVLDPGLRLDAVATSCWPPRDRCGI